MSRIIAFRAKVSSYLERVRHFEDCASEAQQKKDILTKDEILLLKGRDTKEFIISAVYYPRRDRFWRPTRLGVEGVHYLDVSKQNSDQYVVCFIKRGFKWP